MRPPEHHPLLQGHPKGIVPSAPSHIPGVVKLNPPVMDFWAVLLSAFPKVIIDFFMIKMISNYEFLEPLETLKACVFYVSSNQTMCYEMIESQKGLFYDVYGLKN